MLLYDTVESQWHFVDDREVTGAIASGRFVPAKDEQLYVRSPNGGRHTATYEGALEALKQGWEIEPENERRRAYLEKEYGGFSGDLAAGLGGLASGLSLGTSTLAIQQIAPDINRKLALARDVNPVAWGVGEVAGLVGPALLTGGAAPVAGAAAKIAAKGGAKATARSMLGITAGKEIAKRAAQLTPAGILARTGQGVARGVGKAAGKGADSVIARAVAGVAEAVPATIGLSLGNAVLDNKPLTAELLLANVGVAGAIAGGFPFMAAALTKPFKAMAPEVAKIARKVAGEGRLDDPANLAVENKIANWIIKKAAPASHFLSERPQEYIEEMAKAAPRARAVQELGDTIEKHTKSVVQAVNVADNALEDFRTAWGRGLKAKLLSKDFEAVEAVPAANDAIVMLQKVHDDIGEYFSYAKQTGAAAGLRGELKALQQEARGAISKIQERGAQNISNVQLAQTVFRTVDDLKRGLQRRIAAKTPHVKRAGRIGDWEALELLGSQSGQIGTRAVEGVERRLRGFLETTARWGEAGRKQAEVNAAYAKMLGHDDILRKHFTKVGDSDFLPQFKADDERFRTLIGGSHHDVNLRFDEVQGYYQNVRNLAEVFERNFDDLSLQQASKQAQAQSKVVDKALQEAREDISAIKTLAALDKTSGGVMTSAVTAGIVGYHLLGPMGAVGGFMAGGLARPGVLIRRLATMERATGLLREGVKRRTKAAIKGRFEGMPMGITRTAPSISLMTTSYRRDKTDSEESRHQATRRIVDELRSDPTAALESLGIHVEDLRELSPEVVDSISFTAGRARSFLQQKAMEIFGSDTRGTLLRKERAFSESQIRRFERYVLAVENPLQVVDQLFRGYVTTEEAETVRTVYPALHTETADLVMDELAYATTQPPRSFLLQLTQFLGFPVEVTTAPAFAQRLAARDMQASMPQLTNPAGHMGTVNRPPPATKVSEKENVYYSHATTSQRLVG